MKDNRHPSLAPVRASLDKLDDMASNIKRSWPERYPVPPEVDAVLEYRDFAFAQARNGALRVMAEACVQ